MKRRLVRICAFLLLGAIVNVAVAWGFAICSIDPPRYLGTIATVWPGMLPDTWKDRPHFSVSSKTGVTIYTGADSSDRPSLRLLELTGIGWPCRALFRSRLTILRPGIQIVPPNQVPWRPESWREGILAPSWLRLTAASSPVVLPVVPIWPGFAINTVFYAGILWLLFAGPFALRRRSRRRRGLCVKCGYDLRGAGSTGGPDSVTCPECGATR